MATEYKNPRKQMDELFNEILPALKKRFDFNKEDLSRMVLTFDWATGAGAEMDLTQYTKSEPRKKPDKKSHAKLSDLGIGHIIGNENLVKTVHGAIQDEDGVVTTEVSYFGRPYEVTLTPKKSD